MTPAKEEFTRIREQANTVIADTLAETGGPTYAVILASVNCYEALWVVDGEGNSGWLLEIAGASPSDYAFRRQITRRMRTAGCDLYDVIVEW